PAATRRQQQGEDRENTLPLSHSVPPALREPYFPPLREVTAARVILMVRVAARALAAPQAQAHKFVQGCQKAADAAALPDPTQSANGP
ncbi:hypothetical protein OFC17_32860, partial [Escherichia coli]|nr:hypothetical protein [Escherichia coli]